MDATVEDSYRYCNLALDDREPPTIDELRAVLDRVEREIGPDARLVAAKTVVEDFLPILLTRWQLPDA